jgi:hypothetical protein
MAAAGMMGGGGGGRIDDNLKQGQNEIIRDYNLN